MTENRKSGYDRTYQLVVEKLKNCDLKGAAKRLGFPAPREGILEVDFLGRRYKITNEGVICQDDDASRPIEKSLLIYYLTSGGSGEPSEEYLFPTQMAGSLGSLGDGRGLSWQMSPLEKMFTDRGMEEFSKVMDHMGAAQIPSEKEGMFLWQYRILPKISARIIYYEADEEFPCVIQIKFDSGIRRYLEFEPMAFLQGSIVKRIREWAAELDEK